MTNRELLADEDTQILHDLDRAWNEAYPRADAATIDHILAEDWVGIVASGAVIGKAQLLAAVARGNPFTTHTFAEIRLRLYGDSALVTGRLTGAGETADGPFRIDQRYMRFYVKRAGQWQAVATQVTPVAVPEEP